LATWETQARVALVLPGLEEAAAVAHPVGAAEAGNPVETGQVEPGEAVREERCDEQEKNEP